MINYKDFFEDMTRKALNDSEVFSSYIKTQAHRDIQEQQRKEAEEKALQESNNNLMKELENKIATDDSLKKKLVATKKHLINNPQDAAKMDINFINALNMLKLEEK